MSNLGGETEAEPAAAQLSADSNTEQLRQTLNGIGDELFLPSGVYPTVVDDPPIVRVAEAGHHLDISLIPSQAGIQMDLTILISPSRSTTHRVLVTRYNWEECRCTVDKVREAILRKAHAGADRFVFVTPKEAD